MRLRITHHLVDLFFAETRRSGDGDFLFATGAHVFRRHVHDAVRVDVESDFDLRHAARRGRNTDEMEFPEGAIVRSHRAFTLKHVNFDRCLIV